MSSSRWRSQHLSLILVLGVDTLRTLFIFIFSCRIYISTTLAEEHSFFFFYLHCIVGSKYVGVIGISHGSGRIGGGYGRKHNTPLSFEEMGGSDQLTKELALDWLFDVPFTRRLRGSSLELGRKQILLLLVNFFGPLKKHVILVCPPCICIFTYGFCTAA